MIENREQVISKFEELQQSETYNGISLKQFMTDVFNRMLMNNPRSDKRASSLLPTILDTVYWNNKRISGTERTPNYGMLSESAKKQLPSSMR